jgi:hypothetical protein
MLQECRKGRVRRRAAQTLVLNQERVEAKQAGALGEHEHAWREQRHDPVSIACDRLQTKRIKTTAEPQRRCDRLRQLDRPPEAGHLG